MVDTWYMPECTGCMKCDYCIDDNDCVSPLDDGYSLGTYTTIPAAPTPEE